MQGLSSSRPPLVDTMLGHCPHREQSLFSSNSAGTQFPTPFGPTPFTQSQPTLDLLPYYDPRSAHSIEAATLRARRRFIGAAVWAVGSIACLLLVGALSRLQAI
ncbi:hypothetical protein JVU11DRAFT_1541 [Chiua virens]|nr:hypothetical protein JVU11DRAFT_1541 [Chiua virens]